MFTLEKYIPIEGWVIIKIYKSNASITEVIQDFKRENNKYQTNYRIRTNEFDKDTFSNLLIYNK